jgi:hypothetical protein
MIAELGADPVPAAFEISPEFVAKRGERIPARLLLGAPK